MLMVKQDFEPIPIPEEAYPERVVRKDTEFSSFVAYDFETTGIDKHTESIIEVGAVKVLNGKISETRERIFQEFVRPFHSTVTPFITGLTGIRPSDVASARQMWEVIPDFMDFVGDLPMVGYNNISFDSGFLMRAGRYSHRIIQNPQFDVMYLARKFKKPLCLENCKLGTVAAVLHIENPRAHRALADALTTARVFLRLKELSKG